MRMMAKIAPTPWVWTGMYVEGANGSVVALVYGSHADGKMLAAAPDLLDVLKSFIESWDGFSHAELVRRRSVIGAGNLARIIAARVVIARAEGQS